MSEEKTEKRGRPSLFTDAVATEICERLSEGEPLAQICRDNHMPKVTTVWEWGKKDQKFSESIACARVEGFDSIAADCLKISDTPVEAIREKLSKDGVETTKEDALGHRRLQIETRLKLLAKWDPKRYGDKIEANVNHSGDVRIVIGGDI